MFTGLIEELGALVARDGSRFTFAAEVVTTDARLGDSIAVNGCCLTVVELAPSTWSADVVDETLARTNLGALAVGAPVNLERPVRVGDRLGGHIVQGHVDAPGDVSEGPPWLTIVVPDTRYVAEKGSVAVDGVSLTVAAVRADGFSVAVVPHTAEVTTLGRLGPGDRVNVEFDILAKYVERLVDPRKLAE
ncbi:MAG TPA: riboflavin synthase [Acidimicrobiales bacterium]|nr:riboflavin synthase [Acidimicrobiales bacterium]